MVLGKSIGNHSKSKMSAVYFSFCMMYKNVVLYDVWKLVLYNVRNWSPIHSNCCKLRLSTIVFCHQLEFEILSKWVMIPRIQGTRSPREKRNQVQMMKALMKSMTTDLLFWNMLIFGTRTTCFIIYHSPARQASENADTSFRLWNARSINGF